jgi:hypothetical protein
MHRKNKNNAKGNDIFAYAIEKKLLAECGENKDEYLSSLSRSQSTLLPHLSHRQEQNSFAETNDQTPISYNDVRREL